MKIVIVESPLAGDFKRNRRYALWCAYHCRARGEASYASHLYFTQFLDDKNPDDRIFGIEAGAAVALRAGDLFAFYLDLGWSPGMRAQNERIARHTPSEERYLPADMLAAFVAGDVPNKTPGF